MQKLSNDESNPSSSSAADAAAVVDQEGEDKEDDKDAKKKKNRCGVCRKKVGLTGELVLIYIKLMYWAFMGRIF